MGKRRTGHVPLGGIGGCEGSGGGCRDTSEVRSPVDAASEAVPVSADEAGPVPGGKGMFRSLGQRLKKLFCSG